MNKNFSHKLCCFYGVQWEDYLIDNFCCYLGNSAVWKVKIWCNTHLLYHNAGISSLLKSPCLQTSSVSLDAKGSTSGNSSDKQRNKCWSTCCKAVRHKWSRFAIQVSHVNFFPQTKEWRMNCNWRWHRMLHSLYLIEWPSTKKIEEMKSWKREISWKRADGKTTWIHEVSALSSFHTLHSLAASPTPRNTELTILVSQERWYVVLHYLPRNRNWDS